MKEGSSNRCRPACFTWGNDHFKCHHLSTDFWIYEVQLNALFLVEATFAVSTIVDFRVWEVLLNALLSPYKCVIFWQERRVEKINYADKHTRQRHKAYFIKMTFSTYCQCDGEPYNTSYNNPTIIIVDCWGLQHNLMCETYSSVIQQQHYTCKKDTDTDHKKTIKNKILDNMNRKYYETDWRTDKSSSSAWPTFPERTGGRAKPSKPAQLEKWNPFNQSRLAQLHLKTVFSSADVARGTCKRQKTTLGSFFKGRAAATEKTGQSEGETIKAQLHSLQIRPPAESRIDPIA